ncbi:MAG: leucine-rich repeat protein [Lachnospiraceae bacterium]|nr:leucine-rich repeat protein [Lachnospiraceae bacterium]
MAKKVQKKKSMKLRKRLRKTLGSLCLATALFVAAIPVPEASADTGDNYPDGTKYVSNVTAKTFDTFTSQIPTVKADDPIYVSDDGILQFAYVPETGGSNYIAVVLGYTAGNLENNALVIPNTVNACAKLKTNDGTRGGYVAVSKNRRPLYYMSKPAVIEKDVSGNDHIISPPEYAPCYTEDSEKWSSLPLEDFYYLENGDYKPTISPTEQWIKNLSVKYIGNQKLEPYTGANSGVAGTIEKEWQLANGGAIITAEDQGVFAHQGNIVSLTVGTELMGIGNFAFYNCANLETINLGNGLNEIGKAAFKNCYNMTSIGIDFACLLRYISDEAFMNCTSLESFMLPSTVVTIGDKAFDGCTDLTNLDISGKMKDADVGLKKIGYYAFRGCTSLEEVILPSSMNDINLPVCLNAFKDCPNLKHIQTESNSTKFVDTTNYPVNDKNLSFPVDEDEIYFKKDVHPTFYFEGPAESSVHDFTKENALAFKYTGEDRYELVDWEKTYDNNGNHTGYGDGKLTYQVNSNNELLFFQMEGTIEEVEIPASIGPYGVSTLNKGSFSNNCDLTRIKIPATVTQINDEAFKGCHNLKHVIYEDASTITHIGTDAFATQEVPVSCTHKDEAWSSKEPFLSFTGAVGEDIVPFSYAMTSSSNINSGTQPRTYITYYSGWPTNLEIQYVMDDESAGTAGKATLVKYPTYDALSAGTQYTGANYPYITTKYQLAAAEAITQYNKWLSDPSTEVTGDQWDIINAALKVSVPTGVKAIDDGLFSGVEASEETVSGSNAAPSKVPVVGQKADTKIKEVTFADIDEFEAYTFSGCTALEAINITGGNSALADYAFADVDTDEVAGAEDNGGLFTTVNMSDGGSSIGSYAFANNPNLKNVTLSAAVSDMGVRPFKNCPELETVDFSGGPYFTTENAIIYSLENGAKDGIVQCLESRGVKNTGVSVQASESEGVTKMWDEAFMDCVEVGSIDLSASKIERIPANAFNNTESLYSAILPVGCKSITKDAFYDSNVRYVDIPSSVTFIDPQAFNTEDYLNSEGKYKTIEFYCEEGSAAETYANEYESVMITDKPISTTFKVIFWGKDMSSILDEQDVLIGTDAKAPDAPEIEGYRFTGWLPNYTAISKDMDIIAQYEKIDSTENQVTVTFLDWDDTVLKEDKVTPGKDAQPPLPPSREGYQFTGWRPAFTAVTQDTTVYAQYEKIDSANKQYIVNFIDWDDKILYTQRVDPGAGAILPQAPSREGYVFKGWRPDVSVVNKDTDTYAQYVPVGFEDGTGSGGTGNGNGTGNGDGSGSGSGSGDGSGSGSGSGGSSAKYYTLTVKNGSGSGSYIAGSQPIIIANDPAAGMQFSHWTISPEDTKLASKVLSASVVTMPEKDVTVTANYKKATGNSTVSSNRPNGSSIKNGGTTVVIDKNGLSNTGVVSATVNGSSDDFVIKITDSNSATEEIIKALVAEYGDISNIKYFPMDITLYDSTGKKKITDTTGLSISITLPLPDSLITYAGNNKVAGVVNGRLDKLTPKFTTISGVSCVTFTAEHFSPYVIYVDTQNLTAGTITDSTPKTGDGIHPKWFLSIGLACLSAVLFMKKDRRVPVKARARA